MGSLRRLVGRRLPARWANRLREGVRAFDQLLGMPFSGRRPGAVCLFHVGRCGSSVLGEMLNQHPTVRWEGEVYHHRWVAAGRQLTEWDSEAFLRRHLRSSGSRWYGFEMKFLPQQHLTIVGRTLEEYLAEIRRAGVTHHVVLRRRNALRRMISAAAGVHTGRRHAETGAPRRETEPVHLNVARFRLARSAPPLDLVACLDQIESAYAELLERLQGRALLELSFEDDIAAHGPHVAYEKVCGLLGIEPVAARPHTRRLHAAPIAELLANHAEVVAALRGTRHAWMLDDDAGAA